jgi:type IV pilus assembly protein PilA
MENKKGFTLIELLVVAAIIALLTALVLGYLGSAKNKGNNAGVETNLHTVINQAESFFLDNGNSYLPSGGINVTGVCPTIYDAAGTNMFSKNKATIDTIAEAVSVGNGSSCYNSAGNYAVAVGLTLTPNTSWCVDSSGAAKEEAFSPSGAINPLTFLCN